ncbi:MAG: GNAT family N-acetyltransferase [Caryophanon sp.]|nr:GNAT family N-acetyltransferase [Caryophanon sp.]
MNIERATKYDAEALSELIMRVEKSGMMMANPGERQLTAAQVERFIERTSALFVAKQESKLAGYLMVQQENMERTKHRASIAIGVDENVRGQGVGTKLFEACITWAKEQKIHRLELTYIAYNDAARALYEKVGFCEEGVKQHSLYIDGQYVNEYYMVLLL